MDLGKNIKEQSPTKSSQDVLDEFLDKQEEEKKIYIEPGGQIKKNFQFRDISWYLRVIHKPVVVLVVLAVILHILALVPNLKIVMMEVFDPMLLMVDMILFGWLFRRVIRHEHESAVQALVTVFLAGFFLGLLISIFKAFWIREFWTIINVVFEPIYTGLVAVLIGLIVSLLMKFKR